MSVSRSVPSMANHATVPVSRRASASMARRSTLSAMTPHDALGFTTGPIPRRQTIIPSDSVVTQPFVFQRSPASLVNRSLEPEVKRESEEGGGDVWTPAQVPAFPSQVPQVGYQGWSESASGATGFHSYGPESGATVAAAPTEQQSGYPYSQQPQQQQQQPLYGQAGFVSQHPTEQPSDGYPTGASYGNPSYSMPLESDANGITRMPHQHYSEYPWPGAESRWNGPSNYNS
ncbi:hypothetical protein FRC09_011063 [Ceratobasidium sp. 395]|nr:hypothetical protein FRC09_011063 [Ceratobasidium sp. 395]